MWPTPLPAATSPFEVVLINPYELGRQPFGLAEPAALLKHAGFAVACLDLSLQKLDPDVLRNARLVAIHVGMRSPRNGSCPTRLRSVRYPRSARTSDLQFRAFRSLGTVAPSRPTSSCRPSEGADP